MSRVNRAIYKAFLVSLTLALTVIVVVLGYVYFTERELSFENIHLGWPFLLLPPMFVVIFYFEQPN